MTLDKIPLPLRAQPLPSLSSNIESYLRFKFFPSIFLCLNRSFPNKPTFSAVDLDGRVFLHLLQAVPPRSSVEDVITNMIGPDSAYELTRMWNALGRDIGVISCCVVGSTEDRVNGGGNDRNMFSVLPFSHPILDRHLAPVQLDTIAALVPELGRFDLDSSLGALFKDNTHWHRSGRSILPKHLGGKDTKLPSSDPKAHDRALRRKQLFQTGMRRQAESLTGAFGKPLETIVIPPVAENKATTSKPVSPSTMRLAPFVSNFFFQTNFSGKTMPQPPKKTR